MVTDEQVRILRHKLMDQRKVQKAAAAAAGMSVRAARKWQRGPMPSETKRPRWWRTRTDPLAEVWEAEVVPLLRADTDGVLQATVVLDALEQRQPGRFAPGQVRTLQRRMRDWRALHGPEKEVFFQQDHVPGREAAVDFTHATELGVTIAGELFVHLLFQFVLSFSGWRWVCLAFGETFEALVAGIQGALWELGGVPAVLRSDNLSAATHELPSGGRELTRRYAGVLEHYDMRSTRIRPGESHENGVVEKANHVLKSRIAQALVLRGSKDFASVDKYVAFVRDLVDQGNARVAARLAEERHHFSPLPSSRVPDVTEYDRKVARWSTVRVAGKTYSVPSRLIGHWVRVLVHPDTVDVVFRDQVVETIPRLRGKKEHCINYRHVIWSLVRKPGAFARYRYREELFPTLAFRRTYDALRTWRGDRSDIEYVRILHLAASTMQSSVEHALEELLERESPFDYAAVRALAAPEKPLVPEIRIPPPDLGVYNALLAGGAR